MLQVPVCPLCNQPIPVARGTVPDLAVSEHIENNCQVRSKKAVFSNRCNKTKCKKKELVPIICDSCKLNFCLTHRHPTDHDCKGPQTTSRAAAAATARASLSAGGQSKITNFFSGPFRPQQASSVSSASRPNQPRTAPSPAAAAALNRQAGRGSTPGRPLVARTENAGLSEDEALAAALAASLSTPGQAEAEDEDRQLALALQESERLAAARRGQTAGGGQSGEGDKSCSVQ